MNSNPAYNRINNKLTGTYARTPEGAVRAAVVRGLPAVGPLDAEDDLRGGGGGAGDANTNKHTAAHATDYLVLLLRDEPQQVSL
jgi:hypothetical protein